MNAVTAAPVSISLSSKNDACYTDDDYEPQFDETDYTYTYEYTYEYTYDYTYTYKYEKMI
jgi:hypothetical protein